MDESADLMNKIRKGSIGGHRVNSYSGQVGGFEETFLTAIKKSMLLLGDGQWHRVKQIRIISKKYKVDFDRLVNEIGAGLSDNNRWVCIEKLNTPEAPEGE